MKRQRIVHFSSVHPVDDIRVFQKMCRSLAQSGYEVHLIALGKSGESRVLDDVIIHEIPRPSGRKQRVLSTVPEVLGKARELKGDLYHFHDSELLIGALRLQSQTRSPVIFDAHEDVRLQVLTKKWIHPWVRRTASFGIGLVEDCVCPRLAGVVAATPHIAERYTGCQDIAVVQNFPLSQEIGNCDSNPPHPKTGHFVYAGGLSAIRGIVEMVQAIERLEGHATLHLAGPWENPALREQCASLPGWRFVVEHGVLSRQKMFELLAESQAGLVIFHPSPNHTNSQPNKLFEYMASSLPIICSAFEKWDKLLVEGCCGRSVNPLDPMSIAEAMKWFLQNPNQGQELGKNGNRFLRNNFSWEAEFQKLLRLYEKKLRGKTN